MALSKNRRGRFGETDLLRHLFTPARWSPLASLATGPVSYSRPLFGAADVRRLAHRIDVKLMRWASCGSRSEPHPPSRLDRTACENAFAVQRPAGRASGAFPDQIASHNKTQITHFGPDGLMRRHDYTVDILGGNAGPSSCSDSARSPFRTGSTCPR